MSKALRRHHRERLKKKRLTYFVNLTCEGLNLDRAVRSIDSPKNCSCFMCGNQRNWNGNRKAAKTLQEQSALELEKKYQE